MTARLAAMALALAACAAPATGPGGRVPDRSAPDPNGLYHAMQACLASGPSASCPVVDPGAGHVVLRDDSPQKPAAWLLVPSFEVTGIEDPRALRPPVVGFWRVGWEAGARLLPSEPRENRGLAINSRAGRTQNLLHIHISCVQAGVREALERTPVGSDWAPRPFVRLAGADYNVRKVAGLEPSPFLRLAALPGAAGDMGDQSLAVIGAADGGYYLVTDATGPGVVAEAEALLDEDCR